MTTKMILLPISLLFAALFLLFCVQVSHAGFIPEEEPSLGGGIQQMAEAVGRNVKNTPNGSFIYPLSRDGNYIVYPGVAWAFQFYLPKDTCFRVKGGEYKYMTNDGEECLP